jgi:DNA repair exonuclease SbcCD nuclease subunit
VQEAPVTGLNLVWYSDPHVDDVGPLSRLDNWSLTVLGKISQVGGIAAEVQAAAILCGGDFFHVKTPSRTTHRLVGMVARLHRYFSCPTLCNVGNHDCRHSNYEFLPESPLGSLFSSEVLVPCYDDHEVMLERGGVKVRVVGIPYHGPSYDRGRFRALKKGEEDHLVVMAHLLASPQGGDMFEGEDILSYAELAEICPDATAIAFGHWHKDQGVVENIPGRQWIVNVGSLTRGSISEDDLARTPCAVVLKFGKDSFSFERRDLVVAPPAKVFDLTRRRQEEVREKQISAFAESLQAQFLSSSGAKKSVVDLVEDSSILLDKPDLARKVKCRARTFLEQALCNDGRSTSPPTKLTSPVPSNTSGPKGGRGSM